MHLKDFWVDEVCRCIYSDNATNFKVAKNLMYANLEDLAKDPDISNYFRDIGIIWHFIPARSPHFGEIWEAAVKLVMRSIVNSRPLLPLSSDPQDLELLTPGHFLIDTALLAIPEVDVSKIPANVLTNYKQLQKLTNHFGKGGVFAYSATKDEVEIRSRRSCEGWKYGSAQR
nr:uncharacterized protein LOC111418315 [Onthophagus taurus]